MANYIHNSFASHIVANLTQAIFYTDLAGKIEYANQACERFNISEAYGQNIMQLPIDGAFIDCLEQLRQVAYAERQTATRFLSLHNPIMQNFSVRCHLLSDETNVTTGFAYVIQGVSREQVLVTNLMENCDDMIYFKDLNSKFLCCSQSLAERLGATSPEEMVGKSDYDYFDSECATGFFHDEQGIIRSGKPILGKVEAEPRLDGSITWVTSSKMPLMHHNGEVIGTFGISRDITAQKQFELELEKTNKQLINASRHAGMAEVATNVIHNVGNVLNSVITSFAQVQEISTRANIENIDKLATVLKENSHQPNFLQNDPRGKQIPSYLAMVAEKLTTDRKAIEEELASTKRHLEHIKTIVAMQQQFAVTSHIIEDVNLTQLIEDAISISSSSLENHNIRLVRDYSKNIIVSIDQHQVMQILVNLIRNAKHACQDTHQATKQIEISVVETTEDIQVSVTDNGVGIDPKNLVKLFNHGFTTKKSGHGFGLHSGANSAKSMGGSLVATSDGLGHGATFTLTLPCGKEQKAVQNSTGECERPCDT